MEGQIKKCQYSDLKVMQYNVQTCLDVDGRKIMYTKMRRCGIAISGLNEKREKTEKAEKSESGEDKKSKK